METDAWENNLKKKQEARNVPFENSVEQRARRLHCSLLASYYKNFYLI